MKAFICILVLAASAHAGLLVEEVVGAGGGGGGGYSYGGGQDVGHGPEASIIKVIHERSQGYGGHQEQHSHHGSAPAAIIKVIHEEGHSSGGHHEHHQHVEAAPHIVQVIHEDHGHGHGQSAHFGPAPIVAPGPVVHHIQVIHEHAGGNIAGFAQGGGVGGSAGYSYGVGQDHGLGGGAQEVKIFKIIQEDQSLQHQHHHHQPESHGWA